MSGPDQKPFKARLGFDANNERLVNLANPINPTDGMNLQTFVERNTVPAFDPIRLGYPAGFVVEYDRRLFKAKTQISGSGPFNIANWAEIRAHDKWIFVSGNYVTQPGDCVFVKTSDTQSIVTLPPVTTEGDVVRIVTDHTADLRTVIVVASIFADVTLVNGQYHITASSDTTFIWLGGAWRVYHSPIATFRKLVNGEVLLKNSYNYVDSSVSNKVVQLPAFPRDGQWVVIADANNNGGDYFTTVNSASLDNIQGNSSYILNRFGFQATFVYDQTNTTWRVISNIGENRMYKKDFGILPNRQYHVALTGSVQYMTLPTLLKVGDWVDVITTIDTGVANETAGLQVDAGAGDIIIMGASTTSPSYAIYGRGTTRFVYSKANTWVPIETNDLMASAPLVEGLLVKNAINVVLGSASNMVYLPKYNAIQAGDFITVRVDIAAGTRVAINVGDATTDIINGYGTQNIFPVADDGVMLTYIYRGKNNANQYSWDVFHHGKAYLRRSANLSDIPDVAAARANLGVLAIGQNDSRYHPVVSSSADVQQDPNTTVASEIVTSHSNSPSTSASWYISTQWLDRLNTTTSAFQVARNGTDASDIRVRTRVATEVGGNGQWGPWSLQGGGNFLPRTGGRMYGPINMQTPNGGIIRGDTLPTIPEMRTVYQDCVAIAPFNGNQTGSLIIEFPIVPPANISFEMTVDVLTNVSDGRESFTATIKGSATSSSIVVSDVVTDGGNRQVTVRTGINTNGKPIIVFFPPAVTWTSPKISLRNVGIFGAGSNAIEWQTALWPITIGTPPAVTYTNVSVDQYNVRTYKDNTLLGRLSVNTAGYQVRLRSPSATQATIFNADETHFWLMKTAAGNPDGDYDSSRPFRMEYSTGNIYMDQSVHVGSGLYIGGTTYGNWFVSTGATGWINQTFNGGFYMTDSTWIRTVSFTDPADPNSSKGNRNLLVHGDMAATGDVTAFYSDRRLKTDLKPIQNALETVKSWNGYTYRANELAGSFGYDTEKPEIGLIAQEVQATTPEAVAQAPFDLTAEKGESLTGENYLTLKYERLVPVLVEAIKEQDKEIQELKSLVSKLLSKFEGSPE